MLGVFMTAKKTCGISQDSRVAVEAGRRYHAVIGLAQARLVGRCRRIKPVAELESLVPQSCGESTDSTRRTWAAIESN